MQIGTGTPLRRASKDEKNGIILRVEKASIHDGEGLRSVVFFKGCHLRCAWCSTPESQRFEPEIGIDRSKCTLCGACADKCPSGALRIEGGRLGVSRGKCTGCFDCAGICPSRAIKAYGERIDVEKIADEVSKDDVFYFHSGGGVTLSGGEPCAQPEYAAHLLRDLKSHGIDTAMETCLHVPWENLEKVLPYLDSVFIDLKHTDPSEHEKLTGGSNWLILENIKKLAQSPHAVPFTIRIPLIPGLNDGNANLMAVAALCNGLERKPQAIELLPYHRLGVTTYALIDKPYTLEDIAVQPWENVAERARFLASETRGIPVTAGGQVF